MKKLFIMLLSLALMIGFIWADKIEVTKTTIIRSAVMAKDNVGVAKLGDQFDVMAAFGAWHFIEITADSDNVGKQGWTWRKLLDTKNKIVIGDKNVAGIPGIILHTKPSTASPIVCKVKETAKYKLIKKQEKWYQIGADKFIYYYNTKKI